MDVERFARELPELFDDFPRSERPRDRRFREVLEHVPGLARENNLALLNLAAACLEPGESYVEAGTFRGTSLIGAALGNEGDFVGIDAFSMDGADPETLRANLERFGVGHATVLAADALDALRGDALGGRRVGVFYYDADHAYEVQLEALRLVERHLADRALVVVDDSDWERVSRAVADYLAGQPRVRLLVEVGGSSKGTPWWWEGMQVIAWQGR